MRHRRILSLLFLGSTCSIGAIALPPAREGIHLAIKINHFGYRPGDAKIAVVTADPGRTAELRRAGDTTLAFSIPTQGGSITGKGKDAQAGDSVWRIYHQRFPYGSADFYGKPRSVDEPAYPYFSGTDKMGITDNVSSTYGPFPGLVPDGPNQYYSGSVTPPRGGGGAPPLLPGLGVQRSLREGNCPVGGERRRASTISRPSRRWRASSGRRTRPCLCAPKAKTVEFESGLQNPGPPSPAESPPGRGSGG